MTGSSGSKEESRPVLFVGRTTLDVLYWLDKLPEEDTKAFARAFRAAPGGPACNAAMTCALLGGKAILLSAIGNGMWSDVVRAKLTARGVALIDLAEGTAYEMPLTTVLASSEPATRTIVNPPLAEARCNTMAAAWNQDWGPQPRVVLTDGFHLTETLPLLKSLRDAGSSICLDGGSWKPGTDHLVPLLDVAICSERFHAPQQANGPEAILEWFAGQGIARAAVTRGAHSILGTEYGRDFEIEIPSVQAIDTLGAGDVLHGAFCFEFDRSGDFELSLRKAARLATRSCQGLGIDCWTAEPGQ